MNNIQSTTVLPTIKAHHHSLKLMGCAFVLTAVDMDPQRAWDGIRAAEQEILRIERLISSWTEDSETAEINRQAGHLPVKVSQELFQLIQRSLQISKLTAGAFDISGTLSRDYWDFNKQEGTYLPEGQVKELRRLIDYKNIVLNERRQTVYLKKQGMKIGFGGIGKGYAAFSAHEVMKALGVRSGLINAAGDLMCWGNPPGKSGWDIHLPDPFDPTKPLLELLIPFGSVVSSGSAENFTLIDGVRYSHIIDPRTGCPVTGTKGVSVICPNPEFGDALATAISVLGPEQGIRMVDRINGVECVVIDDYDRQYFSKNLQSSKL